MKRIYKNFIIAGMAVSVVAATLIFSLGQTFLMNVKAQKQACEETAYRIIISYKENSVSGMSFDTANGIIGALQNGIQGSIESKMSHDNFAKSGEEPLNADIVMTDDNYLNVSGLKLEKGRFITKEDMDNQEPVCVMHSALYYTLGSPSLGDFNINIKGEDFTVIGVVTGSKQGHGKLLSDINYDNGIFVPVTSVYKYIAKTALRSGLIMGIAVKAPEYSMESIESLLSDWNASNKTKYPIKVERANEYEIKQLNDALRTFAAIFSVSLSVLVLAGINIIQLACANIIDRRKELGLCIALGAAPGDIIKDIVSDILVCSLKGGYIGIVLAGVIQPVLNRIAGDYGFSFNIYTALAGVVLALLTGLITSVIPVRRVLALNPVTVLRQE